MNNSLILIPSACASSEDIRFCHEIMPDSRGRGVNRVALS
jgi:hypothetical protein